MCSLAGQIAKECLDGCQAEGVLKCFDTVAPHESIPDVDVDLQLSPPDQPGTARRPGLVIVRRHAIARAEESGGLLTARDVLVAVEIVSPGSRRMDTVVKRGEYAEAGIPHYWIIDLDPPVSVLECHLAGAFGYQDAGEVTGVFESLEPFPVRLI